MSVTLSPAIKVFALIGAVAALALGGGLMFLGSQQDASLDDPIVLPTKKGGLAAAPVAARKVAAKASASASAKKRATSSTKASAPAPVRPTAKAKPAPKPLSPVAANGLPRALATALAGEPVVVLALYESGSKVDPIAFAEAEAGARAAGAGFVAIDVTKNAKAAEALTIELGRVLRTPAVLVFTRPETLSIQLDGYRDRETVAQAAQNALR